MWCCLTVQQSLKQAKAQSLLSCTGNIWAGALAFGPRFTLADFQPQNYWHVGLLPTAGTGKSPTHYSSQNIVLFPIPSWLPKLLAYHWHLRVFSSSQHMENRASPHEKSSKELNRYWIIPFVSLSFADTFLTNILYMTPPNLPHREKSHSSGYLVALAVFTSPFC